MTQLTRGAINDAIAVRALTDPEYRQELLLNPKGTLSRQLRQALPRYLKVEVVTDTADTVHLVLPYSPPEDGELSDADLEIVAGGKAEPPPQV